MTVVLIVELAVVVGLQVWVWRTVAGLQVSVSALTAVVVTAFTPAPAGPLPILPKGDMVLVDADERVEHARRPVPAKRPRQVRFEERLYEQVRQRGDDWVYRECR